MRKTRIARLAILSAVSFIVLAGIFLASSSAFADTSIKYGWVALDANNKTVLSGSEYALSGEVRPITQITNDFYGKPVKIDPKKVVYLKNKQAGTAQALILGDAIPGYKDAFITTFKIVNKVNFSDVSVGEISQQIYTGKALTPKPKVTYKGKTLEKDVDYTLSYDNNKAIGTASVTVKGKGTYSGSVKRKFEIKGDIASASIDPIEKQYYTGKALEPASTVKFNGKTLKRGTDYTVAYNNQVKVGKATLTVKGKGNYVGTKSVNFTISKRLSESVKLKKASGDGYTRTVTLLGKTYKLYKQKKGSYKNVKYGSSHANKNKNTKKVSNNGCGPSSVAIVLSGYGSTKNPGQVAKACTAISNEREKITKAGNAKHPSSPQNMALAAKQYGANIKIHKHDKNISNVYKDIKKVLENGHQIVIYVGKQAPEKYWKKFTGSGCHWISVLGIDSSNDKVFVGNPGSAAPDGWFSLNDLVRAHVSDKQWNGCYGAWIELWK